MDRGWRSYYEGKIPPKHLVGNKCKCMLIFLVSCFNFYYLTFSNLKNYLFLVFDEAKQMNSKYISRSREIKQFVSFFTIENHNFLHSYHCLDQHQKDLTGEEAIGEFF